MIKHVIAATALALPTLALAQSEPEGAPSPNAIVEQADPSEWVTIAAEDLLVMKLAPDADGNERKVIMQLMPAPFSQGWVENIRTLARSGWYDGVSVNRVQDNYVVQWGDPGHDNPESGEVETKPLPEGLNVMGEEQYKVLEPSEDMRQLYDAWTAKVNSREPGDGPGILSYEAGEVRLLDFPLGTYAAFDLGFPYSLKMETLFSSSIAPVHCYGMVGVGRSYSPDTGSGAELYTVIGHGPAPFGSQHSARRPHHQRDGAPLFPAARVGCLGLLH